MTAHGAARLAVLRNRDFSLYLVARLLGTLAVQMQTVAVGWQVYEVTRDPLDLGLIGLSQFLPFIAFILPAGHLADSRDRRRIVTFCYALECLCALLLLAIALRGMTEAAPVFAVMTLFGVARAFADADRPGAAAEPRAARAVRRGGRDQLFHLADRNHRRAGAGWHHLPGRSAGRLRERSGPVRGRDRDDAPAARGRIAGTAARVGDARDPALGSAGSYAAAASVLGAISLDLFAVLFGGATALLPVYAADVLHAGPDGLGWLRTAPAIGAAACGIVLEPAADHAAASDATCSAV